MPKIGLFRFRIVNRFLGKFGRRWIALDRGELLQDRSRKTCRRIAENVQRFAGECRRDHLKENNCPQHEAILSDSVERRQAPVGFEEDLPFWNKKAMGAYTCVRFADLSLSLV